MLENKLSVLPLWFIGSGSEGPSGCDRRIWPSCKGRMVDALAPEADEGRGKLRKAPGSRTQASIRGSPNRETACGVEPQDSWMKARPSGWEIVQEGQPREVKHLSTWRKRNQRDSLSSGERKGNSLNRRDLSWRGCRAHPVQNQGVTNGRVAERSWKGRP